MVEMVWRKRNSSTLLAGILSWYNHYEKQFLKKLSRTAICSGNPTSGHRSKKKHNLKRSIHFSGWRILEGNKGEDFPWCEQRR